MNWELKSLTWIHKLNRPQKLRCNEQFFLRIVLILGMRNIVRYNGSELDVFPDKCKFDVDVSIYKEYYKTYAIDMWELQKSFTKSSAVLTSCPRRKGQISVLLIHSKKKIALPLFLHWSECQLKSKLYIWNHVNIENCWECVSTRQK